MNLNITPEYLASLKTEGKKRDSAFAESSERSSEVTSKERQERGTCPPEYLWASYAHRSLGRLRYGSFKGW